MPQSSRTSFADRSQPLSRSRIVSAVLFSTGFVAPALVAAGLLACDSMAMPALPPPTLGGGSGASTPVPGEISVSEIMFNPASPVDDNDGEWFEVTNVSTKVLDLTGLFFQDLAPAGSATAPYFQVPPGALPDLWPGESFVFARSADPSLNGGLTNVHYAYSVATGVTPPADKSKVSHTGMALSNSSIDFLAITTGAQASVGGFVLELVTYDPTKAPYSTNSGIAFERGDLLGPWSATNVAASTGSFGSVPQSGTPGAFNSNDVTLYPSWYHFPAPSPGAADTGSLLALGPASVHGGIARLRLSNGPPASPFAIAISPVTTEWVLLGGTVLVDLLAAAVWDDPGFAFDASGSAALDVPIDPLLLGAQLHVQWFAWDFGAALPTFSNRLSVDVGV